MADVRTSIDIQAQLQDVRGLVTDPDRLAERVGIHRDLPAPPPQHVHEGSSARRTPVVAGTWFPVGWTAIEVDVACEAGASLPRNEHPSEA